MIFDPHPRFKDFRSQKEKKQPRTGDSRDGKVYDYTEPLVLTINVALATGRPLLLRGQPGCGKSSVAFNVARVLNRCYYEKVITSRAEAHDLMWRFDAVRRLSDAQVGGLSRDEQSEVHPTVAATQPEAAAAKPGPAADQYNSTERRKQQKYRYIEPDVLWWVFDEASAQRRGLPADEDLYFEEAKNPIVFRPPDTPTNHAVILLDEIDKAEPDIPNNLLVALGSMQFEVEEIQTTIRCQGGGSQLLAAEEMPLVIITTNEERQLPSAFLRRCIVFSFPPVDDKRLAKIAEQSEGTRADDLYERVAKRVAELAAQKSQTIGREVHPSIAEYLDAVRACVKLEQTDGDTMNEIVERATWKHTVHER